VSRTLLCLAAVTALLEPFQLCRAGETRTNSEMLIQLHLQPAPAPKPALRYRLLPELMEMKPGNPIQTYLKCFMGQHKFFFDEKTFYRREKLLAMPLEALPALDLLNHGRFALSQADSAARLDALDWQILPKLKTDGDFLLLPDLAELRTLANPLKVRFRAEVALGRFDDALRTAKTMFAMSRHLGEHPTFIASMLGITVANTAIGPLEEMLERPGCPNLFWALTNLPNPLVSLEKCMEGQRVCNQVEFRNLDDNAAMSADQLKRFVAHIEEWLGDSTKRSVWSWLDARAKNERNVSDARQRLMESGLPADLLLRFPANQVILLDEKREFDICFDDAINLLNLPAWQIEASLAQPKPARKSALVDRLIPNLYFVRRAQALLDQRIALLRHVEALRLFAAGHGDSFPAKLSDVSVPLPDDPFTGKPFRYELMGTTAHLRGSPPLTRLNVAAFNVHYELTIQK
jgi:hypothetical protein